MIYQGTPKFTRAWARMGPGVATPLLITISRYLLVRVLGDLVVPINVVSSKAIPIMHVFSKVIDNTGKYFVLVLQLVSRVVLGIAYFHLFWPLNQ